MPMALNKQSPIPLYYQLAERIKEQIQSGELSASDQLPSERELGEQMGVSRMTARQAVAYLVQQGLLEVKPGVGTFVAAPKLTYDVLHLLGFTEETMRQGGTVASTVLEQSIVTPPLRVASALQMASGAQTIKIVRLRQVDGVPMLLETSFIPVASCPGLERADLAVQSLYTLLEVEYGLRLQRARQTFEATVANEYEQQLFNLRPGAAMILLEGVTYSDQEQPVEYFKAIYRGDRLKFALESQRNGRAVPLDFPQRISVVLA